MIVVCGLMNSINLYTFVRQSIELGFGVLTRLWSIIDLIIIVLNFNVVLELFVKNDVFIMRQVEAGLFLLMWFKSLYFLALIGQIAPLVDIIFVIFKDIKYFMVIFFIALVAFINAFYMIGKNQKELAEMSEGALESPPYHTWIMAAHHVYTSSLGEFDTDFYFQDSMSPWLICLFLALSFFMCIHLLNMLIAIMGESFANNNTVAESKKRMSQLAFVVENWWIDPLKDKDRIVYIVGAFHIDMEVDESEKFKHIYDEMKDIKKTQSAMRQEMSYLQTSIDNLAMAQMQSKIRHTHKGGKESGHGRNQARRSSHSHSHSNFHSH